MLAQQVEAYDWEPALILESLEACSYHDMKRLRPGGDDVLGGMDCVTGDNHSDILNRQDRNEIKLLKKARAERRPSNGGKWTVDEDNRLRDIVELHGAKNWKKISSLLGDIRTDVQCLHRYNKVLKVTSEGVNNVRWASVAAKLPGRLGKQCRERWFNHLDPSIKKGDWTSSEDRILFEAQRQFGNRWCEVAKILPGRTENAVKNRWHSSTVRRWLKEIGLEPGPGVPMVPITQANSELILAAFTERLLTAGVVIEPDTAAALNSLFLSIRNGTDQQDDMGDDDDDADDGMSTGGGDVDQPDLLRQEDGDHDCFDDDGQMDLGSHISVQWDGGSSLSSQVSASSSKMVLPAPTTECRGEAVLRPADPGRAGVAAPKGRVGGSVVLPGGSVKRGSRGRQHQRAAQSHSHIDDGDVDVDDNSSTNSDPSDSLPPRPAYVSSQSAMPGIPAHLRPPSIDTSVNRMSQGLLSSEHDETAKKLIEMLHNLKSTPSPQTLEPVRKKRGRPKGSTSESKALKKRDNDVDGTEDERGEGGRQTERKGRQSKELKGAAHSGRPVTLADRGAEREIEIDSVDTVDTGGSRGESSQDLVEGETAVDPRIPASPTSRALARLRAALHQLQRHNDLQSSSSPRSGGGPGGLRHDDTEQVPLQMLPYFKFLNDQAQRSIMRQLIYRFQRTSCTPRNMVMLATPRYGSNHWGQGTGGGGGSAAAATLGMGLASMSVVTGFSSPTVAAAASSAAGSSLDVDMMNFMSVLGSPRHIGAVDPDCFELQEADDLASIGLGMLTDPGGAFMGLFDPLGGGLDSGGRFRGFDFSPRMSSGMGGSSGLNGTATSSSSSSSGSNNAHMIGGMSTGIAGIAGGFISAPSSTTHAEAQMRAYGNSNARIKGKEGKATGSLGGIGSGFGMHGTFDCNAYDEAAVDAAVMVALQVATKSTSAEALLKVLTDAADSTAAPVPAPTPSASSSSTGSAPSSVTSVRSLSVTVGPEHHNYMPSSVASACELVGSPIDMDLLAQSKRILTQSNNSSSLSHNETALMSQGHFLGRNHEHAAIPASSPLSLSLASTPVGYQALANSGLAPQQHCLPSTISMPSPATATILDSLCSASIGDQL